MVRVVAKACKMAPVNKNNKGEFAVKRTTLFLAACVFTFPLVTTAADYGKLIESVDTEKAADSVDTDKLAESVDGTDIDYKKAYDSVDKDKAADSIDIEKAKEALVD